MRTDNLIAVKQFCTYHQVDDSFIVELLDAGLIEITVINEDHYLSVDELQTLERLTRLHTDLEINTSGIEAINYLLQRIENMQEEIRVLRNRLTAYE